MREDSGQQVALVEIDWDAGTEYYSFTSVRSPSIDYLPYVTKVSPIKRQVSVYGGGLSLGTTTINLANTDRYFSQKLATASARGRKIRVKFVDLALGLSSAVVLFAGQITRWQLSAGELSLEARDTRFDELFYAKVSQTIPMVTKDLFPRMPDGQAPVLVPVIFGRIGFPWANSVSGALTAYLVDTSATSKGALYDYAYVICIRETAHANGIPVTTAFRYGGATSGTSTFAGAPLTYGSYSVYVVTFSVDQRDTTRPDEPEITVNADGITETDNSSAPPILNPVRALEHFIDNYTSLDLADFDTDLQTTAKAVAVLNVYTSDNGPSIAQASLGAAIADSEMTFRDVIEQFCESFAMTFFMTREGKLATFVQPFLSDPSPSFTVDDETDILKGSFSVRSNDEVASVLQFNHSFRWSFARRGDFVPGQYFERQPDYRIPGEKARLGNQDSRQSISMRFTRRTTAALNAARAFAEYYRSDAQWIDFDLPIRFYRHVELNRYVGVTHWQGIAASGGYANVTARIIGVDIYVQPRSARIHLRAFRRASATIVFDDFARADSNSLGGNYTESENNATALTIAGNKCVLNSVAFPSTQYVGVAIRTETFGNNQLVSVRSLVTDLDYPSFGIGVRLSGTYTSLNGYAYVREMHTRGSRLYKFVNANLETGAGVTQLASYGLTTANLDNDDTVFELRVEGTSLEVWLFSNTPDNSGKIMSASDSAHASGGIGILNYSDIYGSGTTSLKDFYARDF